MVLIIGQNINTAELQSFTEILSLCYYCTAPWGMRSPSMKSIIHNHIIFKHNLLYKHKELKAELGLILTKAQMIKMTFTTLSLHGITKRHNISLRTRLLEGKFGLSGCFFFSLMADVSKWMYNFILTPWDYDHCRQGLIVEDINCGARL